MDIYHIIISIFILCYSLNILNYTLFAPSSFINELCSIYYFLLFLISPLLITFIINKYIKYDFIKLYFIVFVIQWILFLNVNPYPLHQDNKFSIMDLVPKQYRPDVQFMLSDIYHNEFTYPIIIKPIYCSGYSDGVVLINNEDELNTFLYRTDIDINSYMVQEYLEDTIEIGILYEKYPFQKEGKILEILEKRSNDKIIKFDGVSKIDHSYLVNNKRINTIIRRISNLIPNMNVARYDIRLKKIEDLEKGDFKIIEINGTMGMGLAKYIDTTWYGRRLLIGLMNIVSFNGYSIIELPIVMYKSFYSMLFCFDCENLFSLYS